MIISCDHLNLSLADEHVGDITIPTQVIEYSQNFLQTDWPIRLKYLNQIILYSYSTGNHCLLWLSRLGLFSFLVSKDF